jgi:hypothetical protein
MADLLDFTVSNPNFIFTPRGEQEIGAETLEDATAHRAFQPGNEVELRAGYGRADTFIGRAIIQKHLPDFPEEGLPTLRVKGYSKAYLMMNSSGELSVSENRVQLHDPRQLAANEATQGALYTDMRASDIVARVARKYGFVLNIDPTDKVLKNSHQEGIVQKKGMSDYELVRLLANMERREFFVRYEPAQGNWVLNWIKPRDENSTPEFVFRYGDPKGYSTLLSYSAEYGLRDQITSLVVDAWDEDKREWVSVVEVFDIEGVDTRWTKGGGRAERNKDTPNVNPSDGPKKTSSKATRKKANVAARTGSLIKHALDSATQFRLSAGGVAIDVQHRPFKNLDEVATFATRWFRARRDHFLVAKGTLVGLETLRAGQVHRFEGLGPRLSGDYYFIAVKHHITDGEIYKCEYTARKIIAD